MRLFPRYVLAVFLFQFGLWVHAHADQRIPVFVSIVPQKYFVEQIGGDKVEVSVMVRPGANPAVYEPSPSQMVKLSSARLYLAIGVPFENAWLPRIVRSNPAMKVVSTQESIEKIPMKEHHHWEEDSRKEDHGHGNKGHDPHVIADPHIWLSPPLVIWQARNILRALISVDPEAAETYLANYEKFVARATALDSDIMRIFSGLDQGPEEFMVFHPAWGYFARAYGLKQTPVEIEGKSPKPAQLEKLISHARKNGIRVIFVQPQISPQMAETIARAIDGKVITADPLAENWEENLRQVARVIEKAVRGESGANN